MQYYKIEIAADGYFPMDGSSEDNALSIISEHLAQIGLTVLECITEIVEEKDVPENYIKEGKT